MPSAASSNHRQSLSDARLTVISAPRGGGSRRPNSWRRTVTRPRTEMRVAHFAARASRACRSDDMTITCPQEALRQRRIRELVAKTREAFRQVEPDDPYLEENESYPQSQSTDGDSRP